MTMKKAIKTSQHHNTNLYHNPTNTPINTPMTHLLRSLNGADCTLMVSVISCPINTSPSTTPSTSRRLLPLTSSCCRELFFFVNTASYTNLSCFSPARICLQARSIASSYLHQVQRHFRFFSKHERKSPLGTEARVRPKCSSGVEELARTHCTTAQHTTSQGQEIYSTKEGRKKRRLFCSRMLPSLAKME